jgi:tetratricopeptide (TPR) repeat protein
MAADIALAAGFQTTVERFQAQDLYMRGRQSWRTRTREGVEDAVGYYKQAKERDPAFALAYAGLAEAYVNQTNFGYREMVSGLALALASANKALALDPDLAEAHTARGFVQASHLNFAEAEGEFKRALDLKPRYVWAHHYYTLMLMMMGRTTEALVQNEAALSLDPESLAVQATKGIIFAQDRRWAEAIRQLKKAPEFAPANFFLGALHAAEGAFEEAGQALGAAYEKAPDFPGVAGGLAYVLAHTGKTAASKAAIENLGIHAKDHRSLANLAFALGALGRLDEAFKLLDGVIWDLPTVIELRVDPLLEEMRRDPRYGKLLATIIK